jgi:L-alanine-DL-glutamate epimerase-like enolase superfamily enzyme
MKITKVDVMQIKTSVPSPLRPIGCRIHTDEGIYGDGEAGMAIHYGAPAAFGMIRDMARLIIGMDPLDNEVVWEKLYKSTFWGQNGGPVVFSGISAIDIALWDIRGKAFGVPVYKLLGGKRREKLRTYASQLQFGWGPVRTPARASEDYVNHAQKAVSEGYSAVKFDFFTYDRDGTLFDSEQHTRLQGSYTLDLVEERVAAVREAVGRDVDLIMEMHAHTDAQSAIQIGRRCEKYNIFYFEEPNTPSPKTAKYIHDHLCIPIALGERVYTRWQFMPYFENMSVQVVQPDLGNTGGITEGKKIADMAHAYDVGVQAHVCASPLSTAAALHLECAIPNFVIHEHHINNLAPFCKELCIHDMQPVNGFFTPPELPGLGNEWSEYALRSCEKVTVDKY